MSSQSSVIRPNNFSTILGVAKELREIVQQYQRDEKDDPQGLVWLKRYEERWQEKFQQLAKLMLDNKTVASYVSFNDLQERFRNVWLYANKAFSEFSDVALSLSDFLRCQDAYADVLAVPFEDSYVVLRVPIMLEGRFDLETISGNAGLPVIQSIQF